VKVHSHCHPKLPGIVCEGRASAVRAGYFWWEMKLGGYVCSLIPTRKASWRAKFYDLDEHDGEMYVLELCPFCGMDLPQLFPDSSDEMACDDGD
jgi:hypothetical protein